MLYDKNNERGKWCQKANIDTMRKTREVRILDRVGLNGVGRVGSSAVSKKKELKTVVYAMSRRPCMGMITKGYRKPQAKHIISRNAFHVAYATSCGIHAKRMYHAVQGTMTRETYPGGCEGE